VLAALKLGFGLHEDCERLLPVAFQATRDETVLGFDLAVASLGALRLVAGTFDLQPPFAVSWSASSASAACSAAFTPAGVSAASTAAVTASSICTPPTRRHHWARSSATTLPGH
jgi:hypothetical protein